MRRRNDGVVLNPESLNVRAYGALLPVHRDNSDLEAMKRLARLAT